ncbi:unnamed protein product [Brassica rapa]|uniref:Uncharacterized protein n=1 Tax=Brassica campestris TaxID=3711 RepID=A0A8D9FZN9_BRACM|nr:unnamed protein product [Brassica rapa]
MFCVNEQVILSFHFKCLLRYGTRLHLLRLLQVSGFFVARSTRFAVSCALRFPWWLFRQLHLVGSCLQVIASSHSPEASSKLGPFSKKTVLVHYSMSGSYGS